MKIQEILNSTKHRPWEIPQENWKFYQEWNDAIFLHWKVEMEALKKFVPKELEIDTFEGEPWVSLVAFTMEKIRPRNLPSFPPISDFDEINIRTYVKSNSKTGVYFLSIEGGTSLSCKLAKIISELPYRFSEMSRNENNYKSKNTEFGDKFNLNFLVGQKAISKKPIDKWLTERYALFQDTKNSINEFEIHHLEWEVGEVELTDLNIFYPRFSKLLKGKPNKSHYSKGVKVIAWGKNKRKKPTDN
ncbi:MAG: DUF2071 domain-containing protein [Calditrichaeota bacterium]|nr:MAG: DUF2071 domain-containing protein [Calditrichota bacterium]